ncbi:hypothetical protein BGZ82_003436 [Podila clonocystis]|nr:hypothetical protein BGZ82_003436 [Podila clonocystis]
MRNGIQPQSVRGKVRVPSPAPGSSHKTSKSTTTDDVIQLDLKSFSSSQLEIERALRTLFMAFFEDHTKIEPYFQWSFLPLVDDIAQVKPTYQRSLHKTLENHKELVTTPAVVAAGEAPVSV